MQELSRVEAEEKSQLMCRVEEMTSTVEQLTADLEARRLQSENVATELQQARLTLDVCRPICLFFLRSYTFSVCYTTV